MPFGQFAATTQFYLYGKRRCTRTGWEAARAAYPKPDLLEDETLNLRGKSYLITGANAGIGREIATFLASKGGTVYMVCRSPARASEARSEIIEKTKNQNINLLICDCGLEADVRRMWSEFEALARAESGKVELHGLVCNAGMLLNEKTLTSEDVEATFATHLLFGTYLLGTLALPTLEATPGSRLIVVSSGGMYNTKFPLWEDATSTGTSAYDGQLAYAYAKRGQVLLCERWSSLHPNVKVLSCHPGWTLTEAVDKAYGDKKSYLEPLRTPWQGAEGIIWLCVADQQVIQGGEFYLDRSPQVKHIAGPFFTEGSFTKNTAEEVDTMMANLEMWCSSSTRPSLEEQLRLASLKLPLQASTTALDIQQFMGRWFVLASIPTYFEIGSSNGIENYTWNEAQKAVDIRFEYVPQGATSGTYQEMRGRIVNDPVQTEWAISPKLIGFHVPLGISYLVLHLAPDQSYTMVGVPDRKYLWIMTRRKPSKSDSAALEDATVNEVLPPDDEKIILEEASRKAELLGYDKSKIQRLTWTV